MTKLEQKIIELGYDIDVAEYIYNKIAYKTFLKHFEFCYIEVKVYSSFALSHFSAIKPINFRIKYEFDGFAKQKTIDDLQLAFNVMQKDLEILKECEK